MPALTTRSDAVQACPSSHTLRYSIEVLRNWGVGFENSAINAFCRKRTALGVQTFDSLQPFIHCGGKHAVVRVARL